MTGDAAAIFVCAAAAAVGAYWFLKFRIVLPMERDLNDADLRSAETAAFAREMIEAHASPPTPAALRDAFQFGVDRFLARYEGAHLFLWLRMDAIGAFPKVERELIARTGMLSALEPSSLELPEEMWDQGGADLSWEPLERAFGEPVALRLESWGEPGRLWGMLGVVRNAGDEAARHQEGVKILTAHLSALAGRAARFWELDRTREQLEGGLSATMARLDETNLQLIQRAKEMNTLQEITDAISDHPNQTGILNSIVSIVARSLKADLCAFLLLDEDTAELVTQPGAFGVNNDEGSLYRISLQNEDASSVRVFCTGKPFITGDAQNDPQVIAQYARLWKCHSLMVVPLSVEGRTIGVMRVGSFERDHFTPDHLAFMRVIAEEAAVLVESAVLSQKLAEKNLELSQLHSMKDDFVSTVSHEFKTPLTSIKGFLSVLLEEEAGPLNKDQKRFLGITMSAAERLGTLVADMLDISRLEAGLSMEMGAVGMDQVARVSVENHRWLAENKQIRLLLEIPPLLPQVRGNEEYLRQACDNLVSNALKFTPEGGEVTVSLANKGEALQLSVQDSGIGIPEKDQQRIFEKFFRASNRQQIKAPGTGLGLSIAQSIVDKHGGRIWVDSVPDEGTCFHIVVPIAKPSAKKKKTLVAEGEES
jgi:signal transduction histidine kinase